MDMNEDALLEDSSPEGSEEDDSDSFSSEENSGDEGDTGPMEVLEKEFMAATPADQDREGIENLCKQLFKYVNIDLKDFAELLIGQNYVTTVLKEEVNDVEANADDDPDEASNIIYGVYSAVNLKAKKDIRSVQQLIDYILANAGKKVDGDYFKEVLDMTNANAHKPALLLKEKLVNIPGVATAPLMKQLMNDLAEAKEKGMPYDLTHYIHIAKMVRIKNQDDYFVDQDDELIHNHHSRYFDVDYDSSIDASTVFQNEKARNVKGRMFRRVYIFTADQMQDFMNELTGLATVANVMEQAGSSGLKM